VVFIAVAFKVTRWKEL